MYLITSFFFCCAGIMALLIRVQLLGPANSVVSDQQYNELFTMHGAIMLLLFATPLFVGFSNELLPLQIGAPDVAFPRLNLLSYYMFAFGGLILLFSFLAPGGSAAFGWYAYAPLTSATYSPGIGADLWIMGLVLSGFGTILGAVNFITTIFCMRARHDDVPDADLHLERAAHLHHGAAGLPGARGRAAMLYSIGFLVTFLFGGITGVILASPPMNFAVSDSYFIVAHFHYVLAGTVMFAMFAGFYFWWPKMTGKMLNSRLGKVQFWLLFIGFHMTFLVQHWIGVEGMPRRVANYPLLPGDVTTLNIISTVGSWILALSVLTGSASRGIEQTIPAFSGRQPRQELSRSSPQESCDPFVTTDGPAGCCTTGTADRRSGGRAFRAKRGHSVHRCDEVGVQRGLPKPMSPSSQRRAPARAARPSSTSASSCA